MTPRIALLTPRTAPGGGIEVFNAHLQEALGPLEIFGQSQPRESLARVGLRGPLGALGPSRALLARHQAYPFDLILTNGLVGWPLTLLPPEVPVISIYHYTMVGLARRALPQRSDRLTTGTIGGVFDRLAGHGKTVVAVSTSVLGELQTYYGLQGTVISNGVDTTRYRPGNQGVARQALHLPEQGRVGLFVGRPEFAKGYDILVETARRVSDVTFVTVGSDLPAGENLISLGRVPYGEMPRAYVASDFLFCPSRYEGFNLSVVEALACDLPVLVSRAAAPLPDDLSRFGAIVETPQLDSFVAAVPEVAEMGPVQSRPFIEARYSLTAFIKNWRRFIQETLNGGS